MSQSSDGGLGRGATVRPRDKGVLLPLFLRFTDLDRDTLPARRWARRAAGDPPKAE